MSSYGRHWNLGTIRYYGENGKPAENAISSQERDATSAACENQQAAKLDRDEKRTRRAQRRRPRKDTP